MFIHTKNTIKTNIIKTIIGIIPLLLYGLYKNGILLYNKDIISIIGIFKLIYLILIGLIIYIIINIIFKTKIKLDYEFLSIIIIPLFMPITIKYTLYATGLTFGLIITRFLKINQPALIILLILGLSFITKTLEFANPLELLNIYSFSSLDLLWGRNIGGIASTNIILGIFLLVYLSIITNYKYEVAISGLITFALGIIIFKDYSYIYNSMAILSLILIAPDMLSSPITKIPRIIYGSLIGIIGYILTKYLSYYTGVIISIVIINILFIIIKKTYNKALPKKISKLFAKRKE